MGALLNAKRSATDTDALMSQAGQRRHKLCRVEEGQLCKSISSIITHMSQNETKKVLQDLVEAKYLESKKECPVDSNENLTLKDKLQFVIHQKILELTAEPLKYSPSREIEDDGDISLTEDYERTPEPSTPPRTTGDVSSDTVSMYASHGDSCDQSTAFCSLFGTL
eukprot:Gregarina_sp_Poly_1__2046@NODE_1538_length_3900_cov_91_335247_g1015_i0_p3_GENE_NODE_1538_length_3900_cov_91_335247_g1015_i0NODE_1538_length_3900_cov_91_335247_g1015_i0_p3_ORF_typecomplete_len166_score34_26SPATA1_C/PF15743_5/0_0035SMC_Nse1/PF07574_13/0_0077DUF4423/PF14394_6/0_019IL4/PF00727_18/0_022MAGE/PF01454_19/0_1DNA_pol_D_N/PF18018_1/0_13_NODE_1538_length_3900_cov_91_335247_g1015_i012221719